jgi:hypothetical protein
MITKLISEKLRPIKLTDGNIMNDISSETHIYFLGIRLYKRSYSQKIDVEFESNKDNKTKVGFKKPT